MIREIDEEPKVGCGVRMGGFRGTHAICGKAGYADKTVFMCDRCKHKPLADAARALIALLQEDRSTATKTDHVGKKVSAALDFMQRLVLKENS